MKQPQRSCMSPNSLSVIAVSGLVAVLALVVAAPSAAQTPSATAPAPTQAASVPRGDLFAGVAIWGEEGDSLPGFHVSASINSGRHFGFVGDFVFYEDRTTAMGGVRVFSAGSKATLFGQFMIGSAPLDDLAFQPGFGLDLHLGDRTAIRVAGDFKISGDDGSTYVGLRFSTGVVLKLGHQ